MSERLGVWKVWKHTTLPTSTSANRGSRRITHVPPTLAAHRMRPHLSMPPLLRTTGSAIPNLATDPQSQNVRPAFEDRRATMFASAAPSLVSSDVTEETLSNFRAGAYELDYDLELGMMKYAQDDASQQHAVELGCGSVEGTVNNGSVASGRDHFAAQKEGDDNDGVEGNAAPMTTAGSAGSEVDIEEVDKVAMGRQALQ
ncbi:hypothetical protein HYDPIDRAFT_118867 [Hydnomerulius pinastri MD-312]|uniref:Uncharacterized protein n=1 Tax=Hydnomerulius pinastri MD-312 TaxID=994086 RepID=A0A0C9W8L8_9AGAM|nr:hypothetical protein HYDPIDRAFT_118867 [Hydnomerulius pinastri MD-312]